MDGRRQYSAVRTGRDRMTSEYVESVTVELALVQSGEPITIHITGQLENVPLTMEIITRYLEQEFPVGDGIRVT